MKKQEKIEKEIEKTLNQFENVETLEPNPYLSTRIQQRLNERNDIKFKIGTVLKPAFLTLLFAFNIVTTIWYVNPSEQNYELEKDESLIEILSSDFNLDSDESNLLIVE